MGSVDSRIAKLKAVVFDVDGVLTDGRIIYGDRGDEIKFFDVQDGLGLSALRRAGFITAMISARKSPVNVRRAKELDMKLYQGIDNKLEAYQNFLKIFKLSDEEVCYVGDDLIDISVLSRVGFAVAVDNAVFEVKSAAHYVTMKRGGFGAARELCELILKSQNKWNMVLERHR